MDLNIPDNIFWYAFKVFYNRVFEIEQFLKERDIECYLPCEQVMVEKQGIRKTILRPVIPSLLFFRSTPDCALALQKALQNRVILYTRMRNWKRVPVAIPNREMNIFMLVASAGEQGLEYMGDDNPRFHIGDRVQVIDGPFKGAEGHICRIKGNRRLIVSVQGVCAVATSYIPQSFLKKI